MQKFQDVVLDSQGRPVAGAVIAVQAYPGGGAATVYQTDAVGAAYTPTTDAFGGFFFYVADGNYSYTVTVGGVLRKTVTDIQIVDIDAALALKASLASPTFTGEVTATSYATSTGLAVSRGYGGTSTNVALGDSSTLNGSSLSGAGNVAVGNGALQIATTAAANTAVGYSAMPNAQAVNNSTAVGQQAGQGVTSGTENTYVGSQAGYSNNTGADNVAVGYRALYSGTGSNNTAVGQGAGFGTGSGAATSGSNNTFVGYRCLPSSATVSNEITLGNSSVGTLRCQVTSITSLSDARDKTAVADLQFGADFVDLLRPVAFTWNTRDGSKVGIRSSGFIAQELKDAQDKAGAAEVLNLVYESNPDKLEANYGHLIPVLVKAIQDLRLELAELRVRVGP